jgi:hypothetical protein
MRVGQGITPEIGQELRFDGNVALLLLPGGQGTGKGSVLPQVMVRHIPLLKKRVEAISKHSVSQHSGNPLGREILTDSRISTDVKEMNGVPFVSKVSNYRGNNASAFERGTVVVNDAYRAHVFARVTRSQVRGAPRGPKMARTRSTQLAADPFPV